MGDGWVEERISRDGSKRQYLRDRINGKKVTVKSTGHGKGFARRLLADYARKKAAGESPEVQVLTIKIDDALESWIRDEPKDPRTILEYRDTIKKFINHSRATYLKEITKDPVDKWRFAMETGELGFTRNGKDVHQYAKWTIWRLMRNMRAFLRFCFRQKWVNADITTIIRLTMPASTRRFLTRSEAARLIKACRSEKYISHSGKARTSPAIEMELLRLSSEVPEIGYCEYSRRLAEKGIQLTSGGVRSILARYALLTVEQRKAHRELKIIPVIKPPVVRHTRQANNLLRRVMLFGLYTGMRVSEVLAARWEHLNREEILRRRPDGSIVSDMIYVLFIPEAKGDVQRSVALHPRITNIIGAKKRFKRDKGSLFPYWTISKLSQARRRAVKRAGLGRVRFHDLRHSFVRNYLKSGAGTTAELRFQTGHMDLKSLETYAHFSTQDIASTISKMKIQ